MALIVENGSLVSGANSYVTLAEARAFALSRGVTLSATDATVEVLAVKAMDYLEALADSYKGLRVSYTQALQWPRYDVVPFADGAAIPLDEIPAQLKNAQCQLIIDAVTYDLQATGAGRETIRSKVDVIEVEYAPSGAGVVQPIFRKAHAMLAPLLERVSGGLRLERA